MVVGKDNLLGLLEEDMQLLEKQSTCFLSCRNRTKQNKTKNKSKQAIQRKGTADRMDIHSLICSSI